MMALETVFKILLLTAVVIAVIAYMLKVLHSTNFCLGECGNQKPRQTPRTYTIKAEVDDSNFEQVFSKYCSLCFKRAESSDYDSSFICYVITSTTSYVYDPSWGVPSLPQHCEFSCNKKATSVLVSYQRLDNKVLLEC